MITKQQLADWMDLSLQDIEELVDSGPTQHEVGYKGDIRELTEYPCNCPHCLELAGVTSDSGTPDETP